MPWLIRKIVRVRGVNEAKLGKDHPDVASNLNALGNKIDVRPN
jgi:hypothetical protein